MPAKIELPPNVTDFGRRLHRLAVLLGLDSWKEFDRRVELTENHLLAAAKSGNAQVKTLAKIRQKTGVNLNWLVCGDEEEILSSPTAEQTEAILRRTKRRPRATDGHSSVAPPEPPTGRHPTGARKRAH